MRQALRTSFLFVLALGGMAAAPAAAQQGTITGRVITSENATAVANAEVEAVSGGRVVDQVMTNTDGRYRLTVPAGTYDVHIEMVGYEAVIRPSVNVTANGSTSLDVTLTRAVFQLNPVVVSASKRTEKATEAPAHVEVVGEAAIAARPTVTPVDHLRSTPGVDVLTSGVLSTNVVVRGFNNIFSGALHALTDHRIAGVPSLRVNFLHFVPSNDDDLARMEVVLGPGAALYGPNTAGGVLHMVTKSPLLDQGTTVTVSGGTQDLFQGTFRTAQKLNDRFGVKLSGTYMRASEWEYRDPVEAQERAKYASSPFFKQDLMRTLDNVPAAERSAEADRRIALIGQRDFDLERWSGEARADVRATDDLSLVFQGGLTTMVKGIELTGLGAGQAADWRYSYLQARGTMGRLFGQAYVNMSDAGDTYLLRNGTPITDKSKLLVGQLQHGMSPVAWQNFTYGVDYIKTIPQTGGTINGIYEDDDETEEVGGYLQSQTALHPKFDLVLAGRYDHHSGLPDNIFSPRAALVFKPAENRALRVTYNRAFSTPSSLNQFLDLSSAMPDPAAAQLGYSIRVQGTGTRGFDLGSQGAYQMRSPFAPDPTALLPAQSTLMWRGAVAVVAAQAAAKGTPLPASLVGYLNSLQPTAAQIPTSFFHPGTGERGLLNNLNIDPVSPVRETTTTSFEVGYRGVLGNRFMFAIDAWTQKLEDFVTPLTTVTPLLFLADSAAVTAYLTTEFSKIMPAAQAAGTAMVVGGGMSKVPVGVLSSADIHVNGAQLLTTYYNVEDEIDLNGLDFAATYLLTDNLSLGGTLSLVNKDVFTSKNGEDITLNAPKTKWTAQSTYRMPDVGLDLELRARYNASYPVRSGVYNGTACIGGTEPGFEECVDSYTLLDFNASYAIPRMRGATVQLFVQNLLDEAYRSYPGVPSIGRMGLLRLKYTF